MPPRSLVQARVLAFLRDIGLPVQEVDQAEGFMAGVRIVAGGLEVAPNAQAKDILHEAGHLAVVPARFRPLLNDDIDVGIAQMFDILGLPDDPDGIEWRGAIQAGEQEATAWAWAAGQHLGLAPEQIIAEEDYEGKGQEVRLGLATGHHPGVHGLIHADFCAPRLLARRRGWTTYPQLRFWLQGGRARWPVEAGCPVDRPDALPSLIPARLPQRKTEVALHP